MNYPDLPFLRLRLDIPGFTGLWKNSSVKRGFFGQRQMEQPQRQTAEADGVAVETLAEGDGAAAEADGVVVKVGRAAAEAG